MSNSKKELFQGIITPIVTPFNDDYSINYDQIKVLIDKLIAKGVKGIFILGSNGEFHVISNQEKIEFSKYVIDIVNGRVPVYAGVGTCSTSESIVLAKELEKLGADVLSVVNPYFLPLNDDELYNHFKYIADAVKIPIVLYNIPKATGTCLSQEVVKRLARIDNIKAIKDSSGNRTTLLSYLDVSSSSDLKVLVGSDSQISFAYENGATGAVAGTSNLLTEILVSLDQKLNENNKEEADKLQESIEELRRVLKFGTVPSILKRSMVLAEVCNVGPARLPVAKTSEIVDKEIEKMLDYYNLK